MRCLETNIEAIDFRDFGWRITPDNIVSPVWFTGLQLPPSISRSKGKQKLIKNYDGDVEESAPKLRKPPKKKMKRNIDKSKQKWKALLQAVGEEKSDQEKSDEDPEVSNQIDTLYDADDDDSTCDRIYDSEYVSAAEEWERVSDFEDSTSDSSDSDWCP